MTPEQEIWHELVLCGVGGATIARAQQNMSLAEFVDWCKYREKYGSLDVRRAIEHAAALGAYVTASGFYRKPGTRAPQYDDFLPARPKEITLEEAMRQWR